MPGSSAIIHPQAMQHPVKGREKLVDAEMYIDPFIGWRCWAIKVNAEAIWLESITYKAKWIAEERMEAGCITMTGGKNEESDHDSPNVDCGCGIYSVASKEQALGWLNQYWMAIYQNPTTFRCIGTAKLWGKVIRFTRGFLSQYAYPEKIWVPHETPKTFPIDSREVVHELRRTYRGVEVNLL